MRVAHEKNKTKQDIVKKVRHWKYIEILPYSHEGDLKDYGAWTWQLYQLR